MRNVGEYVEARTRGGIKESMRERGEIRLDEKRINRYPWRVTTIPRWRFHQTIDQNFHTEGNDFSRGNENPGSTVCHRVEVWNAPFQEEGLLFRSTFKHRFKPSQAQRLLIRSLRQVSRQRVPPSSPNLSSPSFSPVCFIDATIKRRRGKSWPRASLSKTSPSPDSIHVNLRLHLYRFFSLFFSPRRTTECRWQIFTMGIGRIEAGWYRSQISSFSNERATTAGAEAWITRTSANAHTQRRGNEGGEENIPHFLFLSIQYSINSRPPSISHLPPIHKSSSRPSTWNNSGTGGSSCLQRVAAGWSRNSEHSSTPPTF